MTSLLSRVVPTENPVVGGQDCPVAGTARPTSYQTYRETGKLEGKEDYKSREIRVWKREKVGVVKFHNLFMDLQIYIYFFTS